MFLQGQQKYYVVVVVQHHTKCRQTTNNRRNRISHIQFPYRIHTMKTREVVPVLKISKYNLILYYALLLL